MTYWGYLEVILEGKMRWRLGSGVRSNQEEEMGSGVRVGERGGSKVIANLYWLITVLGIEVSSMINCVFG